MTKVLSLLNKLDWLTVLLLCATLGLAPFVPEPHIWEKLKIVVAGGQLAWIDVFDIVMHGAPWLLLFLKGLASANRGDAA